MADSAFLRERRLDPVTRATISVYDTTHPDNDEFTDEEDKHWALFCEDHKIYVTCNRYERAQEGM
jgi:hypothetical protein